MTSASVPKKPAVLVALALGTGLFWLVLVSPLLAWRAGLAEETAQKQAQLLRVERTLINMRALERGRDGQDVVAFKNDFLKKNARPQVVAMMQNRLRKLGVKHGCALNRSTGIDPLLSDGQTWLGLSLQLQCPFEGLQKLLHSIEFSPPYLFVHRATLRPRARQQGQNSKQLSMMIAEIDLYGAVWPFGSDDRNKAVTP